MDNRRSQPWHHVAADQALALLESHPDRGLDDPEVARRRDRYGPNVLTPRRGQGLLVRFLLQFHQPLIYILLAAAAVTLALGEVVDAAVIFGVVLVNAAIGFVQEAKALKAIEALSQTLQTEATVVRGGRKRRVGSADIVPGDVVLLQSGDKVPADLRLLRCRDLQVAEAALTGESVPVQKALPELPPEAPLADRKNMAYASTLVTFGQAAGVVVATGDHTEVGRISQLIATAEDIQTPLTRRIAQFSRLLLVVILGLAAVNFTLGLARGQSPVTMFMASVALAVAAIPEGLPAAVTITLAIGVSRMARRRAIIRKLPAVETLGSTTVICSDKTGTLTENQMTVTAVVVGGEPFTITGTGYAPEGEILAPAEPPGASVSVKDLHGRVGLLECLRAGALCNDSELVEGEGGWDIQGDPTEGALLVAAAKAGLQPAALRAELPRVDSIPFESDYQYMATLHDQGGGRPRVVYLKGSVEATFRRCGQAVNSAGHPSPLEADAVQAEVAALAARGLRVLAFASKTLPPTAVSLGHDDVAAGLTFLGLQGMIDPPRKEAQAAVRTCQSAGIQVKMITGDHALTAAAIADQLGLGEPAAAPPPPVTGQALAGYSDEELVEVADEAAVFARVAPEQKLRLVRALQARGHVVAMTGDGVNDAPALKQADIGVAMGLGGTDVAREAADMVLTDDNFASIEAAVEEGRGVFDNLTKFIVWTLPTNGGEGLVVLLAMLLGTQLPIAPVQILWVNMVTAVMLGLMLAFEPKEPGLMQRPPRDPAAPILSVNLLKRVGLVSLLILLGAFGVFEWVIHREGATFAEAQTAAVNVIVFVELFYLFNCRSLTRSMFRIGVFTNPAAFGGAVGMLALQVLFTNWGPMNHLFHTAPIGVDVWAAIVGLGLAVYVIVEVEKALVGHALQGEAFKRQPRRAEGPAGRAQGPPAAPPELRGAAGPHRSEGP